MDKLRSSAKLALCGDGQFDSPGYSAKYCTYSIMNCDTDEIIDFCVIQKGQFQGELEKQACEQGYSTVWRKDFKAVAVRR